jgi:hypothetical protein
MKLRYWATALATAGAFAFSVSPAVAEPPPPKDKHTRDAYPSKPRITKTQARARTRAYAWMYGKDEANLRNWLLISNYTSPKSCVRVREIHLANILDQVRCNGVFKLEDPDGGSDFEPPVYWLGEFQIYHTLYTIRGGPLLLTSVALPCHEFIHLDSGWTSSCIASPPI